MTDTPSRSFETSLTRLESVVKELETDGIDLERSVELFAEGRALVKRCEALLTNAETLLARPEPAEHSRPSDDDLAF